MSIETDRRMVELVLGWYTGGTPIPGLEHCVPEERLSFIRNRFSAMREVRKFEVVCDFLPPGSPLLDDARVCRIERDTAREHPDLRQSPECYYVVLRKKAKGDGVAIGLRDGFGGHGAHGFYFRFEVLGGREPMLKNFREIVS